MAVEKKRFCYGFNEEKFLFTSTGKIDRNGFFNSNSKMQSDPLRFLLIRDTARAISDNDRRRRSAWGLREEIMEGEAIQFDDPEVGDWVNPI